MNLGDIVKVPTTVCESGYAKICGIDPSSPHPSGRVNWDYWIREWNPQEKRTTSVAMYVTSKEMERWKEEPRP